MRLVHRPCEHGLCAALAIDITRTPQKSRGFAKNLTWADYRPIILFQNFQMPKHHSFLRIVLSTHLALLLLTGCGGGSESSPPGSEGPIISAPPTLKIRTVRDDENLTAVIGVDVVLHGSDGVSVEQMVESDANGVADLGEIGRDRVTITTINGPLRFTLVDVAVKEHIVRVAPADNSQTDPGARCEGHREVALTSQTNDGEYILAYPVYSSEVVKDDESVEFQPYGICGNQKNDEGNVPIFIRDGYVNTGPPDQPFYTQATGSLYGFAEIPFPSDGDLIVINRDRAFSSLPWTASEPIGSIELIGYDHANRYFPLGGGSTGAAGLARSGTAVLADQVILPTYLLAGYGGESTVAVESEEYESFLTRTTYARQLSDRFPQPLHLEMPPLAIANVEHDQASRELIFTGDLTAAAPLARVAVDLFDENYSNYRRWILYFPSTRNVLRIPSIPSEISSTDFETTNWVTDALSFHASIQADGASPTYDHGISLRFGEQPLQSRRSHTVVEYWRENYPPPEW
ncbi:MAG: hypothetical protein VX549_07010 [Pseudomonadota bacterium]|nr:hypothetical protein [Pseudomonadota bacterium]